MFNVRKTNTQQWLFVHASDPDPRQIRCKPTHWRICWHVKYSPSFSDRKKRIDIRLIKIHHYEFLIQMILKLV